METTTPNRYSILILLGAVFLSISFAIRFTLFLMALPNMDVTAVMLFKVYGVGLFYDLVTFSYFAAPVALYLMLAPALLLKNRCHRLAAKVFFFLTIYALLFDGVAEYFFFDEFGTRFNFIAVDYLVYTREVIGNIRESYPLKPIFGAIFVAAAVLAFALRKPIDRALIIENEGPRRLRYAGGLALVALPFLCFAFVDLSFTAVSSNNFANETAGNGIYDLFAAFRNSELDYERFYPTRGEAPVFARLRTLVTEPNNRLVSGAGRDITREIRNEGNPKKLNVIVVVEESLSAEYLGAFGSTGNLTPNLDRLARESLFFTHVYASGTRTVRGLEALALSTPPLPGESVVKRPHNENLFSWGSLMRSLGYDTKYVYAGYGYFDNMNAFFSHNGFDVVDRSDFAKDEITFANIWGVCDEDLFRKVIKEAGRSRAAGKPFFTMVMTTSNHRPFTYPEGRINIPPGTGRGGGVKYADYSIGRFIEETKRQPWFRDTLFVIVADHCAGSAGKTHLPVKRYEIPLLIYSPAHVQKGTVDRLASQIDVAPTVLGLMNMSYRTRFLGKDIMKMRPGEERAFIATYELLGYIKGDLLLVSEPRKPIAGYRSDRKSGAVKMTEPPAEMVEDMIAYYQGAFSLYKNRQR